MQSNDVFLPSANRHFDIFTVSDLMISFYSQKFNIELSERIELIRLSLRRSSWKITREVQKHYSPFIENRIKKNENMEFLNNIE